MMVAIFIMMIVSMGLALWCRRCNPICRAGSPNSRNPSDQASSSVMRRDVLGSFADQRRAALQDAVSVEGGHPAPHAWPRAQDASASSRSRAGACGSSPSTAPAAGLCTGPVFRARRPSVAINEELQRG